MYCIHRDIFLTRLFNLFPSPVTRYYNYDLSINGESVESHGEDYGEDYLTDVIGRKAQMFLDSYSEEEEDSRGEFHKERCGCHDVTT